MKAKTLGICTVGAMLLTSLTVYSVTPTESEQASRADDPRPDREDEPSRAPERRELSRFADEGTLAVDARVGHAKLLEGEPGQSMVFVEVRGGDVGATVDAPVHLALVVDRSGSMKGERMANAKAAAVQALNGLKPGDTITVLSFDTQTHIEVPTTTIDGFSRENVRQGIEAIALGGDTCISCGVEDALESLARQGAPISRMLVLSDGDANNGVRDEPGFRSIAQRAGNRGVQITTIGVGVDYNEKIMSALAQDSAGRHYFVERPTDLGRIFNEEARALASTVATETEVVIDLGPGVELDRVFDRNFVRAGSSVRIPLGSFSTGEIKTVLLSVRTAPASGQLVGIADVQVRYDDLASGEPATIEGKLASRVTSSRSEAQAIDPIVSGRAQRTQTAAALRDANLLFSQGKLDEAKALLARQRGLLRDAESAARDEAEDDDLSTISEDFDKQDDFLDEAEQGFDNAPASPGGGAPAQSQAGKASVKLNEANAFEAGL